MAPSDPSLMAGQTKPAILFALSLVAFVGESQMTQYVQTNLGYRQPFFIFYLVHSSFSLIFPLHLLYLTWTSGHSISEVLRGLVVTIKYHLAPKQQRRTSLLPKFPTAAFLRLLAFMTVGITCPGLLWFAAISLATVGDVTAIWNTNAFFAYLISVKLLNLSWEPRKLFAVLVATVGTAVVVYGGVAQADTEAPQDGSAGTTTVIKPKAPLIGNLLTLLASFGYGLYQVLYKIYAALPSDPGAASERDLLYERVLDEDEERDAAPADYDLQGAVYPPPFGLYPNFLTSIIGAITFAVLWIPLPFLHYSGAEPFAWPADGRTALSIAGIALGGMIFNAGFMILLGIWGPIVVSVGNLLTIVLMLISDAIFGSGLEAITGWSLLGSGVIVIAFGVLVYDMFVRRKAVVDNS